MNLFKKVGTFVCIYLMLSLNLVTALSITGIQVTPGETFVEFEFETDAEATSFVNISKDGTSFLSDPSGPGTSHSILVQNLEQNEDYQYQLIAYDLENDVTQTSQRATITTVAESYDDLFLQIIDPVIEDEIFISNSRRITLSAQTVPDAVVTALVNGEAPFLAYAQSNGNVVFERILLEDTTDVQQLSFIVEHSSFADTLTLDYTVQIDQVAPELTIEPITTISQLDSITISGSVSEQSTIRAVVDYEQESSSDDETTSNGDFQISLPLSEGENEIMITATDAAGNFEIFSETVYVDTKPPRIIDNNIHRLSPTYSSSVTVTGEVSEPKIDVIITVNPDKQTGLNFFSCYDGVDNDNDGLTDYLEDPGCRSPKGMDEGYEDLYVENALTECSDGIDNDEDGYTDFLDDPGCDGPDDTSELDYDGVETECSDGIDNDNDGKTDFTGRIGTSDPGCTSLDDNSEDSEDELRGGQYVTKSDSQGKFSQRIQLESFDFTLFEGQGVRQFQSNTDNARDSNENRDGMGASLELPENIVRIEAIDKVGLRDSVDGRIEMAHCGVGGDFYVDVSEIWPGLIQPDNLMRGFGEFSFTMDLEYLGYESWENIEVMKPFIRTRYLSEEDSQDYDPQQILNRCEVTPSSDQSQAFVICSLNSWPPERHTNITSAYNKLEDLESINFPLEIHIPYRIMNDDGIYDDQQVHIQCLDVEMFIDRRFPPDKIPRGLLNSSVNVLESTTKAIDQVLPPIRTAKLVSLGSCLASQLYTMFNTFSEGAVCFSDGVMSEIIPIEQVVNGCDEFDEKCKEALQQITTCQEDNGEKCTACAEVVYNRISFHRTSKIVCDRIFCPAVPSAQHYIQDVNEKGNKFSACNDNSPYGPPPRVSSEEFDTEQPGCAVEYSEKYKYSCLGYFNPIQESKDLYNPDGDSTRTQITTFLRNLNFCKAAEEWDKNDEFFRSGDMTYFQNNNDNLRGTDCYSIGKDYEFGELENNQVIEERTREIIEPRLVEGLRDGVSECVKTDPQTGYLFFEFEDDTGKPMRFDQESAQGYDISLTGAQGNITSEAQLRTFTRGDNTYGIDIEGNYYLQDSGSSSFKRLEDTNNLEDPHNIRNHLQYACQEPGTTGGSVGVINDPSKLGSRSESCRAISGPRELEQGDVPEILIDPTYGLINSVRCVCLPAVEAHLQIIREVLNNIKNCFLSLLVSGETTAGVCRAILTQYLCDWIFNALRCFVGAASTDIDSIRGRDGGDETLGFSNNLRYAASRTAELVRDDYGDTATFTALFSQRKLLHSVCLAAFGYDWLPELDTALSMRGSFNAKTIAEIPVAERSILRINNAQGGTVTWNYKIGYFITAGSDLRYDIELICSADNSCREVDGYENGICDCYYEGQERRLRIDGGQLSAGESAGFGDGKGDLRYPVDGLRYDRVVVKTYSTRNGQQNITISPPRYIKHVGAEMPFHCRFITAPRVDIVCGDLEDYEYGSVYFDTTQGEDGIELSQQQYSLDDDFSVFVYAKQDFTDSDNPQTQLPNNKQIPKFARLEILNGGRVISDWTDITDRNELSQSYVVMGEDISFNTLFNPSRAYRIDRDRSIAFTDGEPLSVNFARDQTYIGQAVVYIYAQSATEARFFVDTNLRLTTNEERAQQLENIIALLSNSEASQSQLTEAGIKTATITGITIDLPVLNRENKQIFLTSTPEEGDNIKLYFTEQRGEGSSSAVCNDQGRVTLTAKVTLHDGVSPSDNNEVTPINAVPARSAFTYLGDIQQRTIDFVLICDEGASIEENVGDFQLAACDSHTLFYASDEIRDCLCGDGAGAPRLFGNSQTDERKACVDKQIVTQCETGDTDCVCSETPSADICLKTCTINNDGYRCA